MSGEPKTGCSTAPKIKKRLDITQIDGVLKEQVQNEWKAKEKWLEKYENVTSLQELMYEEAGKLYGIEKEEFDKMLYKRRNRRNVEFTRVYKLPGKPVSAKLAGVKSVATLDNSLELFGKLYISPKYTIDCTHVEPEPPKNQKCIILG